MDRWDPTRLLVDPYAPLVKGRAKFAQRDDFERFQTAVGTLAFGSHRRDAQSSALFYPLLSHFPAPQNCAARCRGHRHNLQFPSSVPAFVHAHGHLMS